MSIVEPSEAVLKRYQLLSEHTRDIILFVRASDLRILEANSAASQAYGYTREELMSKSLRDLRSPETSDALPLYPSSAVEEGILFETLHQRRDGNTFPVEVSSRGVAHGADRILLSIIRDITERKQEEAKAAHLSAIVESSDDAIFSKTLDGIITSWNRGAEKLYGYTADEMIGKPVAVLLPSDRADEMTEILHKIESGFGVVHFETIRQRKDGQRIHVSLTVSPIRDSAGNIIAASAIGRDISERKRTEAELRESQMRYRAMFEQTGEGIGISDDDNRFVKVNPSFCKISGYSEEELLALRMNDLFTPEIIPEYLHQASEGRTFGYKEMELLRKDGVKIIALVTGSSLVIEGDHFVQSIIRDVTEHKRSEEALTQGQKLESIGTLAGGVAHDFNNILGGIMGYAELCLRHVDKDSMLERNILKILKATDRAKHLIEQILTFSRKTDPQSMIIPVLPLIQEVLDFLRASIPSSVSIESHLENDTKPIAADPSKIHEVLLNLATNAVHAMDRKGKLTINLYAENLNHILFGQTREIAPGEYTVVEVGDTGCGMDKSVLSKAFEPFFTTKPPGEGTGMGLSVVLGIVQSFGGEILVESKVGEGSTFKIYLPVAPDSFPTTVQEDFVPPLTGSERIVFVDDERMLVEMATDMLRLLGYTVIGFTDSRDALKYLLESGHAVDILITDFTMPVMNGIELIVRALQIRKNLPVILCTGFNNEIKPEKVLELGIDQLVKKPFRMVEIGRAIREILDKRKERELST